MRVGMFRVVLAAAASATLLLAALPVSAQTAEQKTQAADHWDAGVTALKSNNYDKAATEFEAADSIIPSPKAVRQAIGARFSAHQDARAATLAAKALERYPNDAATSKLASETIEKLEPKLQKVTVTCAAPCTMNAGGYVVAGDATTSWTIYLEPGADVDLTAFFADAKKKLKKTIHPSQGDARTAPFDPDDKNAVSTAPPPPIVAPPPKDTPPDKPIDADKDQGAGWGLPRPVFFISLAATLGVGGVMVWSGIDAKNNPGPNAVRQQCAGKGVDCPAYQDGLARQGRTNVLIGATAGTAGLTAVLGFLTNWTGKKKRTSIIEPTASVTPNSAFISTRGTF